MTNDELITALGNSQQKVMSLTVQVLALKKRAKAAEERAEILEELVINVVGDLRDGIRASAIDYRIGKVMQRPDGDD